MNVFLDMERKSRIREFGGDTLVVWPSTLYIHVPVTDEDKLHIIQLRGIVNDNTNNTASGQSHPQLTIERSGKSLIHL